MSRRKKHFSHENHERWLVSYADFMTLLFAFFVVMFASAQADKEKAKQVAQSVQSAFETNHMREVVAAILGGSINDKGKGNAKIKGLGGALKAARQDTPDGKGLGDALEFLVRELKGEIQAGQMQVTMDPRGLVVSLKQAAFFPSGGDAIDPSMHLALRKVSSAIEKLPNQVRLEGHTDSVPIHNSRFHSNWELSASRSIAMLELLTSKFGIDRSRLAVAGYAENVPISANDTEEGRARNRRVDIVILNEKGAGAEPSPK